MGYKLENGLHHCVQIFSLTSEQGPEYPDVLGQIIVKHDGMEDCSRHFLDSVHGKISVYLREFDAEGMPWVRKVQSFREFQEKILDPAYMTAAVNFASSKVNRELGNVVEADEQMAVADSMSSILATGAFLGLHPDRLDIAPESPEKAHEMLLAYRAMVVFEVAAKLGLVLRDEA